MKIDTLLKYQVEMVNIEKSGEDLNIPNLSFKESLLGFRDEGSAQRSYDEQFASDDDEPDGEEDVNCPVIRATRAEKIEMRRP